MSSNHLTVLSSHSYTRGKVEADSYILLPTVETGSKLARFWFLSATRFLDTMPKTRKTLISNGLRSMDKYSLAKASLNPSFDDYFNIPVLHELS